jgi:hypothetical protein
MPLTCRWICSITLTAALCRAASPSPAAAQVIVGRVVDDASGEPIPEARVIVREGAATDRRGTGTRADGRFALELGHAGRYQIWAERAGYRGGRPRVVRLSAGDTAEVSLRLMAVATRLPPLAATARRRRLQVKGVFHPSRDSLPPAREWVLAGARTHSVMIVGTRITPSLCYHLAGSSERLRQEVVLDVEARPRGEDCVAAPAELKYEMLVRGLPAGRYHLRVLHSFRGGPPGQLALDTTITVR